ncbi:MAG: glycosyl hydrolase [Solirubrobacterales bacterium]
MKKAFAVAVLSVLLGLAAVAAPASASEAAEVSAVPVVDPLNRSESPLSNSGKWTALNWSTGTVKAGQDTASGWGPSDAFSNVNGASWATSIPSGAKSAAGVTLNTSPGNAERYVSVWLDMPSPGSAKTGYQLRWTLVSGLETYAVKLSKWAAGSETVLASNASVSIPSGTRLMISDNGGTVTAWKGASAPLTSLLSAADSTYSGGYAGIEGSGNISRSLDFRSGSFGVPTAYWGAWMGGNVYSTPEKTYGDAPWDAETWNTFESHAGKKASLVHFGQPAPWKQAFSSSPLKLARERGALPVLSMGSDEATLKEIAEGAKDSSLIAWAQAARSYAYPFFFRWDWEMNTTGYAWGKEASENPTIYKEAWWHFHDVVEAQGAINVTWVWCPKAISGGTSLSSLYPGKESEGKGKYVDWTCASVLNYGTNPSHPESWKSFSTIFSGIYSELLTLAPGKPVMVAEAMSSEYGGSKPSWITDALGTQIPSNYPQVKAVAWYNKLGSGLDWPIESSASAQSAFAGSIESDYYAANTYSSPPQLTPISPLPAGSAPSMPTVGSVSPTGPANNNSPTVKGTAPAGSAVHLYTNSSCTGTAVGNALAAAYASSGIAVSVADNTTTTFYANATNSWGASACSSTSVSYTEDSAPPAAPTVSSTAPPSPANNNAPKVLGSAEAGSTVKLYTNSTCTSALAATGTAAAFASPGLGVSVGDNTTTPFYGTATDAAGNVSPCSSTSVSYVEDSLPPGAPTVSSVSPASGSNNNEPKLIGSAAAGSTVKLYTNATCTSSVAGSGTAAAFASPGIAATVADNTTTTFYATATDAAGNASTCSASSVSYQEVTPKVYWGAWLGGNAYSTSEKTYGDGPWDAETWNLFEKHANKKVSIVHFGQPAPWNQAFAAGPLNLTRERGAIPLMDMDPDGVTLKEIVEGKKDSDFITWAKAVKAWSYPLMFRWTWEMNGTWFQWGKEAAANPTLYKEAWWHLHDLVAEQGASNVTWVWCPNLTFSGSTSLSSLYPGDSYVDWTCLDGYNFGTNPAQPDTWKSFSTLYTSSYNELLTLAPSKPIMIGEIGSSEYGGSKASWITDAIGTQIPKNFPKIRAVVWFNKWDSGKDWPIETSASAESAFAGSIASNYYTSNSFGSLPALTKVAPLP